MHHTMSDTTIGGRLARVQHIGRVRSAPGRSFYNLVSVHFLDDGEYHSMGGAAFAKWATKLDREYAKNANAGE